MGKRDFLIDMGYEDSVVFENPDFEDAIVGVSTDGNVVYNYDLMRKSLSDEDEMSLEDAEEFIDYNTLRAIPYFPNPKPIVMYPVEGDDE